MTRKMLVGLILLAIVILLAVNLQQYLNLSSIKQLHTQLSLWIDEHFAIAALLYFVLYVLLTAFSVPGAAVFTLLGAALFGFWISLFLVSFASTLGATIAFLISRYLLKEWVYRRFSDKLITLNHGISQDGALYLFSLRLMPILPFFLINLLMGLTSITTWRYYWVSQLGMLPGTAVYINAGTQLSEIDQISGIISPSVLFSFVLLGLFPLLAKWLIKRLRYQRTKHH
ncbi:TVP38/TMEM64 family protein [Vibrio fujianensis]|uniref:TVP38/TMEM64 family protein n=1 Tax=Vibrio fujianensis TaxID=1974215 RepID=UPI000C166331|nr:TVP38/TMEM64 family protein [Vibrio fujianensis]